MFVTAIARFAARRSLPAILTGLVLFGAPPADAKIVKTDIVSLNVPDKFQVSKSSRGIKTKTPDDKLFA